jgi:signal transduction histidine kinase
MMLLATVAVLLFGLPLAVAVQRTDYAEANAALQRDATRAVAVVPDNVLQAGRGLQAPHIDGTSRIALYDVAGTLLAGAGPAQSALASAVRDGKEHTGHEAGQLVVIAPVLSDAGVAGSVRAAVPLSQIRSRILKAWAGLIALALLVLAVTYVVAGRAARRIAIPFEQLTDAVRALGAGTFDVRLPRWGLQEADAAAAALQATAGEMDQLVTQERDFVRHASHQLRTPLAGLLVQLEQLAATGSEPGLVALERARALELTLDDLLSVRSPSAGESCDPSAVVDEVITRRRAQTERELRVRQVPVEPVAVPAAAVRQALEVVLDNALRHGEGAVTVTVEPLGHSVVIEVVDEGAGFGADVVPGTGLRLATGLMHRFGGDVLVRRRAPAPRVALLLPQASSDSNR